MQKLYYNANIHTLDNSCPIASAMAVINGRIAAIGTKEEAEAALADAYEAIDLGGKTVIPGLTDTHMHTFHYARSKKRVDLSAANSPEKLVEILKDAFDAGARQNGWLVGVAFDQNAWPVPELPTRDILDKVTTEVPIAIYRACYHVACINSCAIKLLGLGDSCDGILRESFEQQAADLGITDQVTFTGVLSTGQRYVVSQTSADGGTRRSPLTIAVSRPGEWAYSRVYLIRHAVFPEGPGASHPKAALAYPYAVEHAGKLYVGYSNSNGGGNFRNSAELAVIPVASLK